MVLESIAALSGLVDSSFSTTIMENYIPGVRAAQQANYANQQFTKRMAAIDYTIKWQELHREDIRDLMQLTTQRMDLYHVVGTLLLTFGLEWFTDNQLTRLELPWGFAMLFYVSNFCAVGYIIFSVWLAMHAAIASQSIGTRLLTSFARYSLPSSAELDQIEVSATPLLDKFKEGAKQVASDVLETVKKNAKPGALQELMNARNGKVADAKLSKMAAQSSGQTLDQPGPSSAPASWRTDPRRADEVNHVAASENCDVDPHDHFVRFLQEQQRWLSYDAYSRACMSIGMNQMLQALSYQVLGIISDFSPSCAILTFIGTSVLAILLLRLDIADGFRNTSEKVAVMLTFMFPPACAGIAVASKDWSWKMRNLMLVPCFVLHSGWALYTWFQVAPSLPKDAETLDNPALLPRRWRAVTYLNVIDNEQRELAQKAHDHHSGTKAQQLQQAIVELHQAMTSAANNESQEDCISSSQRNGEELEVLRTNLETQLDIARSLHQQDPNLKRMIDASTEMLEYCRLWQDTPEVLSLLEALRAKEVQAWLEEDDKQKIELAYEGFLNQCQSLKLMAVRTRDGVRSAPHVQATEQPTVRLDTYWNAAPQSVFVDPTARPGEGLVPERPDERPRYSRTTSLATTLHSMLPNWTSDATRLNNRPLLEEPEIGASASSLASVISGLGLEGMPSELGGQEMSAPARPRRLIRIPRTAIPPEQLPARIVRSFSLLTACLWLAFGIVHLHADVISDPGDTSLWMQPLEVPWPKPASMFKPTFLFCNSSHLIAASRYATYAASRQNTSEPLADFKKLATASPAALLCGSQGCDMYITRDKEMGPWYAAPLRPSAEAQATVDLPLSWRGPISVSPVTCSAESCHAWVVGWDGAVVVGRLQGSTDFAVANSSSAIRQWSFEPHLDVSPGLGTCDLDSMWGSRRCQALASKNYSSIQGLHVGANGKLLLVLLKGGLLDAWDLEEGRFSGRWQLHGTTANADYTFMCHDGKHELLIAAAHRLDFGAASLFSAQLPRALSEDEVKVGCASAPKAEMEKDATPEVLV